MFYHRKYKGHFILTGPDWEEDLDPLFFRTQHLKHEVTRASNNQYIGKQPSYKESEESQSNW